MVALAIGVWLPRLRGPIDLRWDAGVYYTLGTSLAENKGYRLLNEPGEIKATQYPPLLPAWIAAHQLVLGTSDPTVVGRALRLSFLLLFVGYIAAVYILARGFLPVEHAFGVTLVCLFNFYTSFLSDLCFPEVGFALATVILLVVHLRGGRFSSFLAALCGVAAYALRSVGVCLLAAWAVDGLLKRQYTRALLRLALLVGVVGSWQLYIHSVETEPTYLRPAYAYQRADYLFYNVSYSRNISLTRSFPSRIRPFVDHGGSGPLVGEHEAVARPAGRGGDFGPILLGCPTDRGKQSARRTVSASLGDRCHADRAGLTSSWSGSGSR